MKFELSLIFVIYNDFGLLEKSLPTVLEQKDIEKEIIIIDNKPSHKSQETIKNLLDKIKDCTVNYYPMEKNLGYSGGANFGIKKAKYRNVAILNADIILTENYCKGILEAIYKNHKIAGATGKILKYDFDNNLPTNVIDTTGIMLEKNLKAFDRGQGEVDQGQYDKIVNIFGICGAIAIFKKNILQDLSINQEYYDEDFIAYKEDVDLCWRINKNAYHFIYVPDAIAYHGRALGKINDGTLIGTIRKRRSQSPYLRELSLSNQRSMVIKNLDVQTLISNFIPIYLRWNLEFLFSIIFEPLVYIRSWKRTLISSKKMIEKRKNIKRKRSIGIAR